MQVEILPDSDQMAREASRYAAGLLRACLAAQARVRLVAATGASQMQFLEHLGREDGIDWKRVELFHLDEYLGMGEDHPASFARYIRTRIVQPFGIVEFHLLDGTRPPAELIAQANALISSAPVDLAFVGIGENAHLAFNDPPADFQTKQPYLIVNLDKACRQQQVREGWFAAIDEVPRQAISMSIHQILQCRRIVCVVPGSQKAAAVKATLEGAITPQIPASILREHPDVKVFLDEASASRLRRAS